MKTLLRIQLVSAIAAALSFVSFGQSPAGVFEYPVVPGTDAWKRLASHDEMISACQIPADKLRDISTSDLLATCLAYPLLSDIAAYDQLQKGLDAVVRQFNGLRELLSRKDASRFLVEKYVSLDPSFVIWQQSPIERGRMAAQIRHLDLLLAQDAILANLAMSDKRLVVRDALQKASVKLQHPDTYGLISFETIALLVGRVMKSEDYAPFNQMMNANPRYETFLRSGSMSDVALVNSILAHANTYVKQQ